jgi:periplasmic protein TonB
MNNAFASRLDYAIDELLAGESQSMTSDGELRDLVSVAESLLHLPSPVFRERLRRDLLESSFVMGPGSHTTQTPREEHQDQKRSRTRQDRKTVVPPAFSTEISSRPLSPSRLAISFALHVVALAMLGASSLWVFKSEKVRTRIAQLVPGDVVFPVGPGNMGGGGGGGDHDKMRASKGTPPRFSSEQLTPPTVIVRNEIPKLPAEATVVGPPDVVMPETGKLGDPLAVVLAPNSNGTGSGGGIGSGDGGGVGSGNGPGVGEGTGGGLGGGVFRVGGGVSAPRAIYDPDPEYSEEARKAKYQGSVVLRVIIGSDGRPRNLQVVRSLGMGLDQKALDAVAKWRFAPATKDGRAVAVLVDIEVAFRLY